MNKEVKNQLHHYIFLAIIVIMLILSYKILRPYFIALISAFILSYLTLPLYKLLNKKLKSSFSAILCILIVFLIILIPVSFIIANTVKQAYVALSDIDINSFFTNISKSTFLSDLHLDVASLREKVISFIINIVSSIASYLPSLLVSIIVMLFGMYYMLTNWSYLSSSLERYLPFKNKKSVIEDISKTTRGILYGMLLLAFIEFIVTAIGFAILGVNSYLLLAALVFILAFIPNIGPGLVWIPLVLISVALGNYSVAIGTIILGLILSIPIDTILRTKLLGKTSNIHPLIMLLGVLGGLSLFGIFGFIIGPLVLLYTIRLIEEAIKQSND
ncbi:AI-2E family transporter [Candidatus Pacearchaeota archaeon]|nr:AI-2E family transporter [Candidatus Pacearchaeota archaeon]